MHQANGLTVTNYILRPGSLCVKKKSLKFPLIIKRGKHLNKEYEAAMQIENPTSYHIAIHLCSFWLCGSGNVQVSLGECEHWSTVASVASSDMHGEGSCTSASDYCV